MAFMYGILSVAGWIALVVVLGLLFFIPPKKSDNEDNGNG